MIAARQVFSPRRRTLGAALFLLFCAACNGRPAEPVSLEEGSGGVKPPPLFRAVTAQSGVRFAYRNGEEAGHFAILEVVGGRLAALDFDGDGRIDLFLVGGGYYDGPDKKQIEGHPCKLYRNVSARDGLRFEDVTAAMGLDKIDFYSHGAAVADFDNDGRIDLAVSYLNEPVTLLHNEANSFDHHWLGLELRGANNRDVVGARVVLEAAGRTQTRFVKGGGSYLSANDRRLVFGLGLNSCFERLRVIWPSGKEQTWREKDVNLDRHWRLTENDPKPQVIGSR